MKSVKYKKVEEEDNVFMDVAFTTIVLSSASILQENRRGGRTVGSVTVPRQRKNMNDLFVELGPNIFRRMYRMEEITFMRLFNVLNPFLAKPLRKRGRTPNDDIEPISRLSMAIRWMAGGDKYDIGALHGVHPDEVLRSL